jgi:hypothetical protein
MRRIFLLCTVAAVLAASLILTAVPAFAAVNCDPLPLPPEDTTLTCNGGTSLKSLGFGDTGGFGGHNSANEDTGDFTSAGGSGLEGFGGAGGLCTGNNFSGEPTTCTGNRV